jgi:hypothetical protein
MSDTLDASSLMASAYICTVSTDQLMLGLAGHTPLLGVFITAGGVAIAYRPTPSRGKGNPIVATCYAGSIQEGYINYPPHMLASKEELEALDG